MGGKLVPLRGVHARGTRAGRAGHAGAAVGTDVRGSGAGIHRTAAARVHRLAGRTPGSAAGAGAVGAACTADPSMDHRAVGRRGAAVALGLRGTLRAHAWRATEDVPHALADAGCRPEA